MIFKKKEFFLLIFLILLQSCSGGRIGNFLESSFNDLEKIRKDDNLQNNLVEKKILVQENKENNDKKNKKIKKVENPKTKNDLEDKKDKEDKKIKKVENPKTKNDLEDKKNKSLEKLQKQKNNKIKKSTKKRNIDLQSYKIIFILKDVDPKDPTEELSSILSNSEVNFEIEKIERILDSKNKIINKN
jgi:hypothetical protein